MTIRAETSFSLNDQLFNADTVALLSRHLKQAAPAFRDKQYCQAVLAQFPELGLKQRINCLVDTLEEFLPEDFEQAVNILQNALPAPLDPELTDDDFGHFIWVVPGEYVAKHGCTRPHLQRSLNFLREATQRFSSESAIRPFLATFRGETMAHVQAWVADDNYHVRRLASEGIRPFLPWAPRANVPVGEIIDVLDNLYQDPTRYVTRSVANTLNDISRLEPDTVIATLQGWQKAAPSKELDWVVRHALRTLLKADHPGAMALLGYPQQPDFNIKNLKVSKQVKVGEQFTWTCTLNSNAEQQLKVNLHIHYLKANGSHSTKVFAVKDGSFKSGDSLQINKKQVFKPMTTRVLYPGTHYAELTVNGVSTGKRKFLLKA